MNKSRLLICILLIITLSIAGCSNEPAKSNTSKESSSEQTSIILGDVYVNNLEDQEFYCMRVKDNYYKIVYAGTPIELLSADNPTLFPDLKDGEFARVTADIEETISDFGYVPVITVISTKITKLESSEPMDFEDITKSFNLPTAGSEENKNATQMFQYTHKRKLYLIFVYNGHVTAYTKKGMFIDYEFEKGEDQFKRFFEALK